MRSEKKDYATPTVTTVEVRFKNCLLAASYVGAAGFGSEKATLSNWDSSWQ